METFGINWVGVHAENGRKLLLPLVFSPGIAAVTCDAVRFPSIEVRREPARV